MTDPVLSDREAVIALAAFRAGQEIGDLGEDHSDSGEMDGFMKELGVKARDCAAKQATIAAPSGLPVLKELARDLKIKVTFR